MVGCDDGCRLGCMDGATDGFWLGNLTGCDVGNLHTYKRQELDKIPGCLFFFELECHVILSN